jgi:DNA-binding NarL/FixJ family response regulator
VGIRILIIDDHHEYRTWLGHHLTAEWGDAEIIGHDPTGGRPLPEGLAPSDCDLILLDHTWSGGSGLDVLSDLKRRPGCPPVIMMTPQGDKEAIAGAFQAGADDFLPKSKVSHEHLVQLVREALRRGRKATTAWSRPGAEPKTKPAGAFALKGHEFVRLLARGGVSSVYLMRRLEDRRPVVVKVLTEVPDVAEGKNDFERFLQEYELISAIRHRNVVEIYDLGIADDHAYIAMEYFPEGHLGQRIGTGLTTDAAVGYLEQMARALTAIHAVGVLHRDLKPGNVMLRVDDSLALIDFGLAKQLRTAADITHTGEIFGTPYYMSPEQGHGDPVDERGDIYSLGVIFYEMLTGSKPYAGASPMAVIYKHSHSEIPALPEHAAHLQALLEGMLAKDPSERFQSADDLLAAIVASRAAA